MNRSGDELLRPREAPSKSVSEIVDWLTHRGEEVAANGDLATSVSGLSLSSHRVQTGDLYAALPGAHAHGAAFSAAAVGAGAVAILTDPVGVASLPTGVPSVVVPQPRRILGSLSAWLYGEPASAMKMVGVTGTQGKTTTTWLAESALQSLGLGSSVVGTVGTRIQGRAIKTSLTTPEAPDLQALFAVMREQGVATCLMEVSSHALVLGRVDGTMFDVAVFTNLGRDHLDFHANLEDYFQAKASLFAPERARFGVVSIDDSYGRRLAAEALIPLETISAVALDEFPDAPPANWHTRSIATTLTGSRAVLRTPTGEEITLEVPMPGRFNVANAVAAVAACARLGIDPALVAAAIGDAGGVPGRMEWVKNARGLGVVVDYAHKPDALRAALEALRSTTNRRIIVVFGAGGDRDHGKRPMMGAVASDLADIIFITDDNPRSEDPAAIRAQVRAGISGEGPLTYEIGDRREAIHRAVALADVGDVVLIAGKGHETGQEVHGVLHEFDDRTVALEALTR